jgi:chromosome partitioning protein
MKTIVFAGSKGGSGKSTLSFNAAVEAAKRHSVLIADLDPQQSLKTLWDRRGEKTNPRLVSNVSNLAAGIAFLKKSGIERDFFFIDTPGSGMAVIRDALAAADLVVMPAQPSPLDWDGSEALIDACARAGVADRLMVVINRCDGKSGLVAEAEKRFKGVTRFPIQIIRQREAYASAAKSGLAGIEQNREATTEIRALWAAIQSALEHQQSAAKSRKAGASK